MIQINPGAGLAANESAMAAFQLAADRWEAIFDDDVTVNINADFVALGSGVLGDASSAIVTASYALGRQAMINDGAGYTDNAILNSLPTNIAFNAPQNITVNAAQIEMTRANAKALGLINAQLPSVDATIRFSTLFTFDFDPSDGIIGNAFDFVAVAAHEIGHALGFVSSVDDVDLILRGEISNRPVTAAPLDLFRFEDGTANDPSDAASFATAVRSLSPGVNAIFDDTLNEWRFSTGTSLNGDRQQASHWKDGLGIGLMDPTLGRGQIGVISDADIRALDLIGWNRASSVPEPSSLVLAGIGVLSLFCRRRR